MLHLSRITKKTTLSAPAPVLCPQISGGEVWLVGSGPGQANLMTVLGREVLFQADVVFHDRLGCEEILQELPSSIELVNVGKAPGKPTLTQEQTNERLAQAAREGNRVVRLKGGDPFIFGRGMEEVIHLNNLGITTHVVPGLSSSVAGPSAAGVPLTHRTVSRGFSVQTGREEHGAIPTKSKAETRVYLMAMSAMGQITETLITEGFSPDTPAAIVTNASTYREQVATGTLATIVSRSKELGLRPPGILVIGETAKLASEKSSRKTIVVTSSRVPKLLEDRRSDATLLWRPVAKSEGLTGKDKTNALDILTSNLNSDWIIFNSRPAVEEFFNLLFEAGYDARKLAGKLLTIGAETASALEEQGLIPDQAIVNGHSASIANQRSKDLQGRSVLFPSSLGYNGNLTASLEQQGAKTTQLPIYRFVDYTPAAVDWNFVDTVSFASPRAVQRFRDVFPGAPIEKLTALYIGDSTLKQLNKHGFKSIENLAGNDPAEETNQHPIENHRGSETA